MVEIGGFVGLAALFIVVFTLLRREIQLTRIELRGALADLRTALKAPQAQPRKELQGDIAALHQGQAELREGQAELRERMARLEGVLDGLREAVTWRAGPRDAA